MDGGTKWHWGRKNEQTKNVHIKLGFSPYFLMKGKMRILEFRGMQEEKRGSRKKRSILVFIGFNCWTSTKKVKFWMKLFYDNVLKRLMLKMDCVWWFHCMCLKVFYSGKKMDALMENKYREWIIRFNVNNISSQKIQMYQPWKCLFIYKQSDNDKMVTNYKSPRVKNNISTT